VVPNGPDGTSGSATQGIVTTPLQTQPFPVNGNQFDWSVPYNSNLTGPWTLRFQNGEDTTDIQTPSVGDAPKLPFAARPSREIMVAAHQAITRDIWQTLSLKYETSQNRILNAKKPIFYLAVRGRQIKRPAQ
jgi:hypothetical protein